MNRKGTLRAPRAHWLTVVRSWFDAGVGPDVAAPRARAGARRIEWPRLVPYFAIHAGALAVFWVGFSWAAVALCVGSYAVRMFGITAFYHRYFAHRAFRASRAVQFLGAAVANSAAQRGPLWWAAHHRKHHKHADTPADAHSPSHHGMLWCHTGWWASDAAHATDLAQVPDLAKFPELRWLDRYDAIVPILFAASMLGIGWLVGAVWPTSGLTAAQGLVWGFFVPTVLLYHATFTINSLCHRFGSRRYETRDESRNHPVLALLTFGEGWHNNHHHYPVAARQGFFWWEVDLTYYALRLLARLGIVSELRPVPVEVRGARSRRPAA